MKTFKVIEKGRDIYRFIRIPKEYIDMDLEIQIKPAKKPVTKFSDFLTDSYTIDKYKKFDRNLLNERY